MKNRNWKKNAAAIALVGAIAAGGVVAGAVATRQQITAELRPDIGLTLNGQSQTLDKSIIAYNGTTYLPIRNIGELMGLDVDWNGTTQTVILNEQTGTTTPTPSPVVSTTPTTGDIGLEKAKSIALADAGLTASQVTFTKARQDWDDGRMVYDVDFYTGTAKYDYEILASDGTVLQREKETFSTGGTGTTSDVGLEKAKSIALADAGLTASQVTFTKARQDWDDGRMVYDVDFYTSTTKYDYEIAASDGTILQREQESFNTGVGTGTTGDIGLEKAKSIALSNAGLSASQVTFTKARQDWDDGRMVYDVEFYTGTAKYDYEIAASNGAILQKDQEKFVTSTPATGTTNNGSYIGVEKAKSIALANAGLSASQVTFVKAQQDWDDGRMEYEIEFYYGGLKYEYTINAANGTILDMDMDRD